MQLQNDTVGAEPLCNPIRCAQAFFIGAAECPVVGVRVFILGATQLDAKTAPCVAFVH